MGFLAKIFANTVAHSGQIITDVPEFVKAVEDEFVTIAHGEGGAEKIAKIAALLPHVASSVAKIAADLVA